MITTIDKDGTSSEIENFELEQQIRESWNGLEVSNITIDQEFDNITATVKGLGKYMDCGFVEDYA